MIKKIFLMIVSWIMVLIALFVLPSIVPERKFKEYNDEQLRQTALSRGMRSVPKNYDEYLNLIDNSKNPLTKEKVSLGKELFFDKTLSKNSDVSCSTCHMLTQGDRVDNHVLLKSLSKDSELTNCAACHQRDESGTDRLSTAVGTLGKQNPLHLNTMSVLNSSLAKYLTWNGEVYSVEEQAGLSIKSPFKMDMLPEEVNQRLRSNPKYVKQFNSAFKRGTSSSKQSVNYQNVKIALGTYVRTLLTRSAYDEFLDGDNDAISAEAKRGFASFINLGCKGCHTGIGVGGQVIKRFPLKGFTSIQDINFNFPFMSADNSFPFDNVGGFLGKDNDHYFRVPILRNVTKTSPYFHNGSVSKIREAVRIMGQNQIGINLSDVQIDEIVEFLRTLEGDIVDYSKDIKSNEDSL